MVGPTGFELTIAESDFIKVVRKAAEDDRQELQQQWAQMLKAVTPKASESRPAESIAPAKISTTEGKAGGGHAEMMRAESKDRDVDSQAEDQPPYRLMPPNQFQWRNDPPIALTLKEWRLLEYLLHSPMAQVQDLIDAVWGSEASGDTGKLDTTLTRLRKKLMPAKHPIPITLAHAGDYVSLTFDPR